MSLVKHINWVDRSLAASLRVCDIVDGRALHRGVADVIEKFGPRDGRHLLSFGGADQTHVDRTVAVARRTFQDGRWSRIPVQRRKATLLRLADLIEERTEELALLESLDVGKPITDAYTFDVPAASNYLRFCAEAADKLYGKVYGVDTSSLSYELIRPVGVVAGIVGWNFPLYLAIQKIGPVLATGNSLILKPSELASLSTWRVAELALEAGVPDGVLNVIHGDARAGSALAHHPDVNTLTFTGSTRTGKELLVASGRSNMKHLVLECGGKAPNIVFDDCTDLSAVAETVVTSALWNQGQVCVASSRLLVQANVKDALLAAVVQKMSKLEPGDPLCTETRFGALVSAGHKKKVMGYIESAEQEGARLAYQSASQPPFEGGFYVPPTVFDEVDPQQRIAQEEVFGPVLSVLSFRDEAEALHLANNTIYGLSAILWSKDSGRAHRLSQAIAAGWIVINATDKPMGGPGEGVMAIGGHKQSGIGVEGGIEGLEAYTAKSAVQWFV